MLVFDRGYGVEKDAGTLLVGHQDAALQSEGANELAIIGVDFGYDVGAIGFERANFGQVARINEKQAGGGAEENRAEKKKGERDAVN